MSGQPTVAKMFQTQARGEARKAGGAQAPVEIMTRKVRNRLEDFHCSMYIIQMLDLDIYKHCRSADMYVF